MAQVSKICSGVRTPQFLHEIPKSQKPNSVNLFSVRSPFVGAQNFRGLKYGDEMRGNSSSGRVTAVVPLKVSASAVTTEKPPTVPEIVLQPIKEISGTIHLPGSKSLSNRILLLAALSEVCKIAGFLHIGFSVMLREFTWLIFVLLVSFHGSELRSKLSRDDPWVKIVLYNFHPAVAEIKLPIMLAVDYFVLFKF